MKLSFFAAVLMFASFAVAQAKPADQPAAKVPVPLEQKEALRAAVHKQDQVKQQLSDLNVSFMQMQQKAMQEQQRIQGLQKQADDELAAAKEKAYAAASLDKGKYDIDLEGMEFSAKPEPKSEAKK